MLEGLPGLNKDRVLQRCNHLPHSRNFPEEFTAVRLLCIGAFSQPAYRTTSNSAVLVHNHSFSGCSLGPSFEIQWPLEIPYPIGFIILHRKSSHSSISMSYWNSNGCQYLYFPSEFPYPMRFPLTP